MRMMTQETSQLEKRSYRYYVLAILTITSMFSIVDRLILSILLEDIKAEFGFTDTQIGLITGVAFTLFYIVFSIPLGWIADRKNRKSIVAISLAAWSAMTAFHGAAVGFWTLFLCRIGVGIGEAGSGPASTSIISDYFHKHELAKAMGILTLGGHCRHGPWVDDWRLYCGPVGLAHGLCGAGRARHTTRCNFVFHRQRTRARSLFGEGT